MRGIVIGFIAGVVVVFVAQAALFEYVWYPKLRGAYAVSSDCSVGSPCDPHRNSGGIVSPSPLTPEERKAVGLPGGTNNSGMVGGTNNSVGGALK